MTITEMPHIKLMIEGQGMWAFDAGSGVAIVDNLPFDTTDFGFRAVVRYDADRRITTVLSKGHPVIPVRYEFANPDEDAQPQFAAFAEYMRSWGVPVEGWVSGIAAVAPAPMMTAENLATILEAAPGIKSPEFDTILLEPEISADEPTRQTEE